MLSKKINFENSDCSCNCSIFPQTELAFSITRPGLEDKRQRLIGSYRLDQKNRNRKQDKISLSEVKKQRQRSKGLGPKPKQQDIEKNKPANNLKYNLQFDSYYAYQQLPIQHCNKQIITSANNQKSDSRRKYEILPTSNNNNIFDSRKNSARIEQNQYLLTTVKNKIQTQESQNRIEIRPLPNKYEPNILSLKITPSIRHLYTQISQPNTASSTKDHILSTQASNFELSSKTYIQNNNDFKSREQTPEHSILSRKSSSKQQPGMYFRAIQSINNDYSQTDSLSQVISHNGFYRDPFQKELSLEPLESQDLVKRFKRNYQNDIQTQKKVRTKTSLNVSLSSLK